MDRFLPVNAEQNWLNKVESIYLVNVFWLAIGQRWLRALAFFRQSRLPFIGWQICKFYANFRDKRPRLAMHTPPFLTGTPAASKSTFILRFVSWKQQKQQTTTKKKNKYIDRNNRKKYLFHCRTREGHKKIKKTWRGFYSISAFTSTKANHKTVPLSESQMISDYICVAGNSSSICWVRAAPCPAALIPTVTLW